MYIPKAQPPTPGILEIAGIFVLTTLPQNVGYFPGSDVSGFWWDLVSFVARHEINNLSEFWSAHELRYKEKISGIIRFSEFYPGFFLDIKYTTAHSLHHLKNRPGSCS